MYIKGSTNTCMLGFSFSPMGRPLKLLSGVSHLLAGCLLANNRPIIEKT